MGDITDVRGAQIGWAARGHLGLTSRLKQISILEGGVKSKHHGKHKHRRIEESMPDQVLALLAGYI